MDKPRTAFQQYLESLPKSERPESNVHPVISMNDNQPSGFLNFDYRTAMASDNTRAPLASENNRKEEERSVEGDPKANSSAMASASTSPAAPEQREEIPAPVVKEPGQPTVVPPAPKKSTQSKTSTG